MPRDLSDDFQSLLLRAFESLGAATGDAFFEQLARCAAEGVGADVALVGALEPDGHSVRSLAFLRDGAAQPAITYDLRGTPCENVAHSGPCLIAEDLQARFPDDAMLAELDLAAYAGAPVRDHQGRVVGLIALMARRPFGAPEMIPALLRAFARRIGGEIEHAETERRLREANAALRAEVRRRADAEARHRDFARISSDWFWETDPQGRFTYVSESIRDVIGAPASVNIGRTREEILGWRLIERDEAAWAALDRAHAAREPFRNFVYGYRGDDGRPHWVRISGAPVFDGEGAFLGYRGVGAEITALRAAEARAQAMEQRLRDAIEAMPAGFALYDAEDRLVLCNTAYRRDAGALAGAPIEPGMRFEDILRRSVAAGRVVGPLALSDPEAFVAERLARHAAPDGLPIEQALEGARWVEMTERRTADGGVVIVRTDVTARKRSELRLLDAIESIPFGFIMCDPDDRVMLVNRRYRELYPEFGDVLTAGTPFSALCEICACEIEGVDDGAARARWIEERLARHRDPGPPRQVQTCGGRSVLVSESRTSEGGYIGVHVDITPLVLMHHELRAATESAESALAVKSRFLATMSHELRTPLNAILGFSELMGQEAKGPLPEAYREYVAIIRSSGEFLLSLITDILDLSRIEAGKMEIERAPLALAPVIAEAAAMLSDQARRKGLVLKVEVEDGLPEAPADRRRVLQILHNLLSNAVKFTERGAVVASARRDGEAVELAVRDSGRGMSAEEIEEAVAPFQQARSLSGSEKLQGTGLGLSIVKALAELHGGALEIRSAPGAGTTVAVRLPIGEAGVGRVSPPPVAAG